MAHRSFRIHLSDGRSFPGRTDHTLLRQLQDAGCRVPVACSNGNCGRCFARSDSGDQIPLCTTYAEADVALTLPFVAHWRRYRCQLIEARTGELVLRLPAGRITAEGDQWLVCSEAGIQNAALIRREGRVLRLACQDTTPHSMITVINVESATNGRYQLREGAHTLLRNLTASTARELQQSLIHYELSITH
ncbi:ferredoxin [Litorivivens lipolytica]|uniref:Ferredoxin n=1 Tax=Litorivivens lipolytica TaxID=1524264 RepID=A0A7W4W795_9GAMM|nr:2Fe-2S iron-sulfur cluster binding domain-containing protein [Litorivivens lipolytica]MBB3048771.1 ferredoxin [Litorivivens lipolytica]